MQSLFASAFGAAATVDVAFTNVGGRLTKSSSAIASDSSTAAPLYIYSHGDDVTGEVRIAMPAGRKLEHVGIKVELKGVVELFGERSGGHEFTSHVKELAAPGILAGSTSLKFSFAGVDMHHESYEGIHARCRYFVRVTVSRSGYAVSNIVKDQEFFVQNVQVAPEADSSVKLEVGIEDCLHIEFEYDSTRFHLGGVITGKVNFLLVRIKIKYMELAVIRRELAGAPGSGGTPESETLSRFEVMDGCPVRGELIPLRLYLGGIDELTPTYSNIANAFTVRYFVNLVLVDEEDRRYFKQQEITLWRNALKA